MDDLKTYVNNDDEQAGLLRNIGMDWEVRVFRD